MFFDQLLKLCEERNTTPTKFVTDILNLSSSKVTAWKNGSIPKYEILNMIANYFNVSIGTLFDGRERNTSTIQLTVDEKELLNRYNSLTEKDKRKALKNVKEIANQNIQEEIVISQQNNNCEHRLLKSFRTLSYEEQLELAVRAEVMAEMSKAKENVE